MSFVIKSFPQRFISTGTNASELNEKGNRFSVFLNTPISIPKEAKSCTVKLISASIWNNSPNISAEFKNNQINFVHAGNPYQFIFPDGQYSLSAMNSFLSREFLTAIPVLPADLFKYKGVISTSKTECDFLYATTQIDYTAVNTVGSLLGFDARLSPPLLSAIGEVDISDSVSELDRVTGFLINMSFLSTGIPSNGNTSKTLSSLGITAAPNAFQVTEPRNPIKVNVDNLRGHPIQNFKLALLDQLGRDVSTVNESWEFIVMFEYYIQLSDNSRSRLETKTHNEYRM